MSTTNDITVRADPPIQPIGPTARLRCGECGETHEIWSTGTRTYDTGDPATCPFCRYTGTIVEGDE